MIKQSRWASKTPPRRSSVAPPTFSSAVVRALHWCIAHEAWLAARAAGTDRRLLYTVVKPPVSHDSVTGPRRKWKVLAARHRFSTTSAGQRNSFFFAFASLCLAGSRGGGFLFELLEQPWWSSSNRKKAQHHPINKRHQTFRFGPSLKRWCGRKSCKHYAVKHPAAPDTAVSGEMGQLWNSHTDSLELKKNLRSISVFIMRKIRGKP